MNEFAKQLMEALYAADIDHKNYSGRGMYGERCVAVHCGGRNNVSESDVLEAVKGIPHGLAITRDSMGLGTIVYWPSARLENG